MESLHVNNNSGQCQVGVNAFFVQNRVAESGSGDVTRDRPRDRTLQFVNRSDID